MKNLFVLLLLSLISFSSIAESLDTHLSDTMTCTDDPTIVHRYVHALDGLNLRIEPDRRSPVITKLHYGERVQLIDDHVSNQLITIQYIPGHWAKVSVDGIVGYVFDGFLSDYPTYESQFNYHSCTQELIDYACGQFKLARLDTLLNEADGTYVAGYRYLFDQDIELTYLTSGPYVISQLTMAHATIFDAFLIARGVLIQSQDGAGLVDSLLYKTDRADEIYEIADPHRESVIIRKVKNGGVVIEFREYQGC